MHFAIVFNHPYDGSFCSAMLAAVTRVLDRDAIDPRKIGYRNVKWVSFNPVKLASKAKRGRWLQQVESRFASLAA